MSFLNYYDILNSNSDDNVEVIKRNYQKLALLHHPDKTLCLKNSTSNYSEEKFLLINKAWNVLRDPIKRKIYDAEAYEHHINLHDNVFAELVLEDFHKYRDKKDLYIWSYQCRCGGSYLLEDEDIPKTDSILVVECNECSLTVKVVIKKHSANS